MWTSSEIHVILLIVDLIWIINTETQTTSYLMWKNRKKSVNHRDYQVYWSKVIVTTMNSSTVPDLSFFSIRREILLTQSQKTKNLSSVCFSCLTGVNDSKEFDFHSLIQTLSSGVLLCLDWRMDWLNLSINQVTESSVVVWFLQLS